MAGSNVNVTMKVTAKVDRSMHFIHEEARRVVKKNRVRKIKDALVPFCIELPEAVIEAIVDAIFDPKSR